MLKDNMSFSPFMGDKKSLSLGLNPLGIRTASEQLFSTLLPGMNVVTLRIRYYSFYCWLLKHFYAKINKAQKKDLQQHIRMSELLMALIHAQSKNNAGVPGIIRATQIIGKEGDEINFNEDAMPNGKPEGGYWQGSYGAFGTYYAASLQEIGLILPLADNTSLYNVTPQSEDYICGDNLADAFDNSVGEEMGLLFENCANSGIVSRQQLEDMEPFFQTHFLPDNKERDLLLKLLLQNDRPISVKESNLRRDSLRLLLNYINKYHHEGFSELDFSKYVYDCYSYGIENCLASVGWYAYYLNDIRQYEYLIIFDVLLNRLSKSTKPGQWENIDELTSELAKEVCHNFNVEKHTLGDLLANWDNITIPDEQMSYAFYVILNNYKKNPHYKDCKSIIRAFFRNVSNDALDSFDEIDRCINDQMFHFVKKFLIENIIYNHYSESMRKFSQNGIPTQKLMIENGFVKGLATYSASHSSPRINTLRSYAIDLGLIDNNQLTQKGVEVLNMLQND